MTGQTDAPGASAPDQPPPDQPSPTDAGRWLAAATVDAAVFDLRPDYRALLLGADGLQGGESSPVSERILGAAEATARQLLGGGPAEQLPHLAAWRGAYRAFGAKPQRTRPSVEALLRRLDQGSLPRIDRITDVYNAVSIAHLLPIGGEDQAAYLGMPRLVRAAGSEPFDTSAGGEPVWSIQAPARSSGATTPASPAVAGTGGSAPAPGSRPRRAAPCSSSTPSTRSPTAPCTPPPTH